MDHQYTLFVDEAGDDKTSSLRPKAPNGNSEWLCIGGYLVRSDTEVDLEQRRDQILRSFGGHVGRPLHFRNYKPWNRIKICKALGEIPARAFVVCSFKGTMVGHRNDRAEAASTASSQNQYLYNFVLRLLLERVGEFAANDAREKSISTPKIKVILASRRGHHFGHFKAYMLQLIRQATAKTTYLNTREIDPNLFQYDLIERCPASSLAGLQLADAVVSATFQSIEQSSPHYRDHPALLLSKIVAGRKSWKFGPSFKSNIGMTVFPYQNSSHFLSQEQKQFFSAFGYRFE